jgi:hypothetical protein
MTAARLCRLVSGQLSGFAPISVRLLTSPTRPPPVCHLVSWRPPRRPEGSSTLGPAPSAYWRIRDALSRPPKSGRPSPGHRAQGRQKSSAHRPHRRHARHRHQARASLPPGLLTAFRSRSPAPLMPRILPIGPPPAPERRRIRKQFSGQADFPPSHPACRRCWGSLKYPPRLLLVANLH